jgi:hypothetical protein
VQNFVAARNIALAHLAFDAALASSSPSSSKPMPKCAGRPYLVTDPGPPPAIADMYAILEELSVTPVRVWYPPPVLLLLVAHGTELYQLFALKTGLVPLLTGLVAMMQPSVFTATGHMIVNDEAARRSVEEGGIGYRPVCRTLEGVCEQIRDWNEMKRAEGKVVE